MSVRDYIILNCFHYCRVLHGEREWSRRDEGMKIIIIRTMIRCNVSLMVIIQSIRYSKAKYNIGAERYFCWCFPVSGTMKLLCGSLPCIINRNILPILEYPIGIVTYVWIRLLSMGQCNQIIMNYPWIKADKHSKLKYSHWTLQLSRMINSNSKKDFKLSHSEK